MKNFKLTTSFVIMFFCLSTLLFTGCSKDDDLTNADYSLVGTWSFTDMDMQMYINDIDFITYMTEELEMSSDLVDEMYEEIMGEIDIDELGTIEFKADGTFVQESSDEMSEGEWSADSENTLLTVVEDGYTQEMEITKLTDTELRLSISEFENEDFDADGEMDEIKLELSYTLEK